MKTQQLLLVYAYFHVNKAPFHLQGAILSSNFQPIGLSGQIFVEALISNFTDISPEGTELLYADRWTGMAKPTGVFGGMRTCVKTEYTHGTMS
jgi:hypothetical protein